MNSSALLTSVPNGLRAPLLERFNEICRNFAEHRWEPSELNGGKFAEVVFTILDGAVSGSYASAPSKPQDMVRACRALESVPHDSLRVGDRSIRILIPRMLLAMYEIRNNRGVGHVGGDVDANMMDAMAVHAMARWVIAELIRIFHGVTPDEAQVAVNALVERKLPIVWEKDGIRRVLTLELDIRAQTLVLVYSAVQWVSVVDLLTWTEYKNASRYRTQVLARMHNDRLVELSHEQDKVCLTPLGSALVEDEILMSLKRQFV